MHRTQIRTLARLHGFGIFKGFLARTPRWPAPKRRAYIFEKLKRTLVRAHEGVPFHRKRFQSAGFDPHRDFRSPADLERVPLLTKEEVRAYCEELTDRRFLRGSVLAHTSGTTGEPMAMRLNESHVAFDYACIFRYWALAGYRFRSRFASIRSYVPDGPERPLWKYNWLQNTLYASAYHLKPSNCDQYLAELLRFRPLYIRGYPSSLNVLAEYAWPHRERFDFVRGLFTASETLLPHERANVERTFGKKLFDWYGMTEPAVVITERADHDGMEVNWEYGYPEFLCGDGLAAGERRLVTTSLHNPVMPFIRYDTGDIVTLAEGDGPAGELYPRIRSIDGRKDDYILTPDGGRLPSLNFYSLLQTYSDVLRFQFVQPDLKQVAMKISLRPATRNVESVLSLLRAEVSKRLGPDLALKIEVTDQFWQSPDGKTPTFKRTFALQSPSDPRLMNRSLDD